jgi:hypothetical protein
MSKYNQTYQRPSVKPRPWDVHPIWRGIGCLLMVLIPIISFAGATLLVRENVQQKWVQIPDELKGSFVVPSIGQVLFADLAVTIILMVIGFGLLTIVYALFYRMFGPSSYGPMDAPPR